MSEFAGFISDKLEIKLLILYIADRLVEAAPFEVLQELSMCDQGVDYFAFSDCLADLVRTEHLTLKDDKYLITRKGRDNIRACESGLPYTVRTQVDDIARNARDYFALLQPYFFGARNEQLCLLCLDGKGKVLGIRRLGEGNVNAVNVTTRLIAEAALSLNAAGVVLAHNHVSGIAFPSGDDIATTNSLAPILAKLGVELVDHVIFVDDDMVSLRDSGFYKP